MLDRIDRQLARAVPGYRDALAAQHDPLIPPGSGKSGKNGNGAENTGIYASSDAVFLSEPITPEGEEVPTSGNAVGIEVGKVGTAPGAAPPPPDRFPPIPSPIPTSAQTLGTEIPEPNGHSRSAAARIFALSQNSHFSQRWGDKRERERGAAAEGVWLLTDAASVREALPLLLRASMLGLDTETTGLDPLTDRLRLVQLAVPGGPTVVLDAFAVDPRLLAPLFHRPPLLVGHNLKFDLRFLWAAGLPTPDAPALFDTWLAAALLDAGRGPLGHGLAFLAQRFLDRDLSKALQRADWAGPLTSEMLRYAAQDAQVLLPLHERLQPALAEAGLERVAALEFRALPAVAWLEHAGAPFDSDAWRALAGTVEEEKHRLAERLTALAEATLGRNSLFERRVDWESPPQVLRLLREAGLPLDRTTEEALQAHREHPLVAGLLAFREAAKRSSTYGRNILGLVHPATGRIHAEWRQIGAASGRMSCTRPNLQNIPRDPRYRACFRPAEGRVLVKADYSQIELRLAAEIAGDRRMREAFAAGEDLHALTARLVQGEASVTAAGRQAAKALNFGLLYGLGSEGLRRLAATQYGVELTREDAERLRARWFRTYDGIAAWHRAQPRVVPATGIETRTLAGRRRVGVRRFTELLNTPVQGSGADGLKAALARLWETRGRCPTAAPVLAVHDELVVEVAADEAEPARDWLVACMVEGMQTIVRHVPITVEATIVRDWSGHPRAPHAAERGQAP